MAFEANALPSYVRNTAELMTSRARSADGGVVSTAGYSDPADGGGDDWVHRHSGYAALPSAGKGVLYLSSGGDSYKELRDKNRVSIRTAGVNPSATAANNRAKFQALIDAVQDTEVSSAMHPVVTIPNGVYQIDAPLILDCAKVRDLTFVGENFLYAQIRPSNDFVGDALIKLTNTGSGNLQRCIFREFYLRGDKPDGTRIDFAAKLDAADHCVFDRMNFSNAAKAGLLVGYSYSNAYVNCWFTGNSQAGFWADNEVSYNQSFMYCQFVNNRIGAFLRGGLASQFIGCNFELNSVLGLYAAMEHGLNVQGYFESNGVRLLGITRGSITSGSNQLTVPSGRAAYCKVGDWVRVIGAGDEGPEYSSYEDGEPGPRGNWLLAKITAITNGVDTITLDANATATVVDAEVNIGGWVFTNSDGEANDLPGIASSKWYVNTDVFLGGTAVIDRTNYDIPTNVGSAYSCTGVNIGPAYLTPTGRHSFVTAFGAENVRIGQVSSQYDYETEFHPNFDLFHVHGASDRNRDIRIEGFTELGNTSRKRSRVSAYVPTLDYNSGETQLAGSHWNIVPQTIIQMDPAKASVVYSYTSADFTKVLDRTMAGRDLYEIVAPAAGAASDAWGMEFDLSQYPELASRWCMLEFAVVALSKAGATLRHQLITEIFGVSENQTFESNGDAGTIYSEKTIQLGGTISASSSSLSLTRTVISQGDITSGSNELVLDATGPRDRFRVGDTILIAGAGPASGNLTATITNIVYGLSLPHTITLVLSSYASTTVANAVVVCTSAKTDIRTGDWITVDGAGTVAEMTTGSISSGSDQLTVVGTSFLSVGQAITIVGAGPASGNLATTIVSIASLVVTVANNASTTVSGASVTAGGTLSSYVTAVSGTTLTLADAASVSVTDANAFRSGVSLVRKTFRTSEAQTTIRPYIAFRVVNGEPGSRLLVVGATLRAVGNPSSVLDTVPNYQMLTGQHETFTIRLGEVGETIASGPANGRGTFRAPFAMKLKSVVASLKSNGAGLCTIDMNVNASSVLSTKLTIDSSELTSRTAATPLVLSSTMLAQDDVISFDVDSCTNAEEPVIVLTVERR